MTERTVSSKSGSSERQPKINVASQGRQNAAYNSFPQLLPIHSHMSDLDIGYNKGTDSAVLRSTNIVFGGHDICGNLRAEFYLFT